MPECAQMRAVPVAKRAEARLRTESAANGCLSGRLARAVTQAMAAVFIATGLKTLQDTVSSAGGGCEQSGG